MYITQIKPLENGDYESVPSAPLQPQIIQAKSQKKHEISSDLLSERGYEVVLHVYHTNQTLGKQGLRKSIKTPPFDLK